MHTNYPFDEYPGFGDDSCPLRLFATDSALLRPLVFLRVLWEDLDPLDPSEASGGCLKPREPVFVFSDWDLNYADGKLEKWIFKD